MLFILMQLNKILKLKFNIAGDNMANKENIEYGRILSRDEVLVMLSDNLQDINHKIKHGKIRDKTNAKIKNAQINSMVYLAQNYLKGLKDRDLEQIKQELFDLKAGIVSNSDVEQSMIDSANNGVDLAEIERIESIIESFDGD